MPDNPWQLEGDWSGWSLRHPAGYEFESGNEEPATQGEFLEDLRAQGADDMTIKQAFDRLRQDAEADPFVTDDPLPWDS